MGSGGRQFVNRMPEVLLAGWPAAGTRPELDRWMDAAFANDWDAPLFDVPGKPAGVLEDPNEYAYLDQQMRYLPTFQQLTPVFLARGLQLQARGDPEAFLVRLDAWLAAVRTAKHHTLPLAEMIATGTERLAYLALDRWLERLAGRPDLAQRALDIVRRHDALDVPDPTGAAMAEQVMLQNAVDAPAQWLPRLLEGSTNPRGGVPVGSRVSGRSETEANVVAFAWAVPWEKERLRRAVALGNDPARRRERADLLRGAPGLWYDELMMGQDWRLEPTAQRTLTVRRAAILSLALRLHRLAAGEYPATLAELVPARMAAVPADPFDGRPFRYRRVDRAETVTLPARFAHADRPKSPPGVTFDFADYHSLAGLAGGLTGWPLEPGWLPSEPRGGELWLSEGVPPPGQRLPLAAEWSAGADERVVDVRLAAGRAVLWSVGPDRTDGGGRSMDDAGSAVGDLIAVVSDPPATPTAPAPGR